MYRYVGSRAVRLTLTAALIIGSGLQAASASAHPSAGPAAAAKQDSAIVMPGATSAEGIARGAGSTFGAANTSIINDVALVPGGAWFTDSAQPKLYFVPVDGFGTPGPFTTLTVTGPAAHLTGDFNMNGIAAVPIGKKLIVAHSADAALYTVDPATGAIAIIAGVSVPNVDGIVLRGHRLWAVQNFSNQVSRFKLTAGFSSGTLEKVITNGLFQIPTTAALFGDTLAVVNAKFDTGLPPTASQYEVVLVGK